MVSGRLTRLSNGSGSGAAPAPREAGPGPPHGGSQTACAHPTSGSAWHRGAEQLWGVPQPQRTLLAVATSERSPHPPPGPRLRAGLRGAPCPRGPQKGVQASPPGGQQARSAGPTPRPFVRPPAPGVTPEHTPSKAGEPAKPPGAPGGTFSKSAGLPAPPTGCCLRTAPSPCQGPASSCPQRRLKCQGSLKVTPHARADAGPGGDKSFPSQ